MVEKKIDFIPSIINNNSCESKGSCDYDDDNGVIVNHNDEDEDGGDHDEEDDSINDDDENNVKLNSKSDTNSLSNNFILRFSFIII